MICNKCKKSKPITLFSFRDKILGVRKKRCKSCDKKYRKEYYHSNSTNAKEYALISNRKIRLRNKQFIWDYLKTHPCVDCSENDPFVLEFDHQRDKSYLISRMVNENYSIEKITFEINKCVVRCANCHRRKTARDFKWYDNIKN